MLDACAFGYGLNGPENEFFDPLVSGHLLVAACVRTALLDGTSKSFTDLKIAGISGTIGDPRRYRR